MEFLEFIDLYDEFEKLDTVILGASRDSLKFHAIFSWFVFKHYVRISYKSTDIAIGCI